MCRYLSEYEHVCEIRHQCSKADLVCFNIYECRRHSRGVWKKGPEQPLGRRVPPTWWSTLLPTMGAKCAISMCVCVCECVMRERSDMPQFFLICSLVFFLFFDNLIFCCCLFEFHLCLTIFHHLFIFFTLHWAVSARARVI